MGLFWRYNEQIAVCRHRILAGERCSCCGEYRPLTKWCCHHHSERRNVGKAVGDFLAKVEGDLKKPIQADQENPSTASGHTGGHAILATLSGWRLRWRALPPRTRHWLVNIGIGVVIELYLHLAGHTFHLESLANAQNWALDRMMRVNAVFQPAPPDGWEPPRQTFVDVDDALWRNKKEWGGGEPYRAPREPLLNLVENAFDMGATQVVLDILVEGDGTRAEESAEDRIFADGLRKLLNLDNAGKAVIGQDEQLVLVRTLRAPLPINTRTLDNQSALEKLPFPEGHLSEMRESPLVDRVVKESGGRIVFAAPYFSYSNDRVLRDWQLLQVVCEPQADRVTGAVRVLPSVQMVVAQKYWGLAAIAGQNDGPHGALAHGEPVDNSCTPFPQQQTLAFTSLAKVVGQSAALKKTVDAVIHRYWADLNKALTDPRATRSRAIDIGEAPPHLGQLGNRVVFHSGAIPGPTDPYFSVVSAQNLLDAAKRKNIESLFAGRVVVIGQSYAEAGDRHFTPMGEMPGSMVLLNAIDSMARYQIIRAPSAWVTMPIALFLILVVGYIFARWDSLVGTLISTVVLVPLLAIGSFYLFRYGVWLDFALPLVAIQTHRMFKSFEERIRHQELERLHGNHH